MLNPLADRLLVKPLDEASASPGGILLPENMKHKEPVRGRIVAIGIEGSEGIVAIHRLDHTGGIACEALGQLCAAGEVEAATRGQVFQATPELAVLEGDFA